MATFSTKVDSVADISAARADVWAALTDPGLLAKLTPLLRSIDADGDLWRWNMSRIGALGVSISPCFTERMQFDEPSRIEYTHEPPAGAKERAGAEGIYELSDIDGGTHLAVSLTLSVELPLPKAAKRTVEKVMTRTMRRTGEKFSANLLQHLGATEIAA